MLPRTPPRERSCLALTPWCQLLVSSTRAALPPPHSTLREELCPGLAKGCLLLNSLALGCLFSSCLAVSCFASGCLALGCLLSSCLAVGLLSLDCLAESFLAVGCAFCRRGCVAGSGDSGSGDHLPAEGLHPW